MDDDLEKTIANLIERKYAAPDGRAAYRLAVLALHPRRGEPDMEDVDQWSGASVWFDKLDPTVPCGVAFVRRASRFSIDATAEAE